MNSLVDCLVAHLFSNLHTSWWVSGHHGASGRSSGGLHTYLIAMERLVAVGQLVAHLVGWPPFCSIGCQCWGLVTSFQGSWSPSWVYIRRGVIDHRGAVDRPSGLLTTVLVS